MTKRVPVRPSDMLNGRDSEVLTPRTQGPEYPEHKKPLVEFIVRARSVPTDADAFLSRIGKGRGVEYLADIIRHALFISQGHREDVQLDLVLEKSRDFSRVLAISGVSLGSLGDIHETALLDAVADALRTGRGLDKHESVVDERGIRVTAMSFEQLVRQKAETLPVYLLDPGGEDMDEVRLEQPLAFVMTDHTPMPANSFKSMRRQGVRTLSLGPRVLHAAQCISILLNVMDRL